MILYLSRNESANLLDQVAGGKSLHIHKMAGSFCLSEFVVRDMRKFASCQYFCVERLAVSDNDSEFVWALQSFRMMHSAKVIVILEGADEADGIASELAKVGVTDIVAAPDIAGKLRQIEMCFSDGGIPGDMPKAAAWEPEYDAAPDEAKEVLAQCVVKNEMEDEQYRFDCLNVKIGVIGATRRVGTTTAAMGLASYINKHGGTACYVALNVNRHLESIAEAYGFDAEDDYYTYDSIDFYECMKPKYDYNFIILDFGDIYHGDVRRDAVKGFKECAVHLLCGASQRRFEVVEFAEALKAVRSVKPVILAYSPGCDVGELFGSAVTREAAIIRPVMDMLDFKTNRIVFEAVIRDYVVETSKRL